MPGRDQVSARAGKVCAKHVYDQAGITNPWKEIHTAEIYVPFAWFEAMSSRTSGFATWPRGGSWSIAAR